MRLTIAYSKIKKLYLLLINNALYQRETLSERPIRQPLRKFNGDPMYIVQTVNISSRQFTNTFIVDDRTHSICRFLELK